MSLLTPIFILLVLFAGLAALVVVAERLLVRYEACRVDVNGGGKTFQTEGGQNLLDALLDAEIYIASGCGRRGTCGLCKVHVTQGGGPVLPTELGFLTRKEIRAGVRLACRVKVREDLRIRIPEEYLEVKLHSSVVADACPLTYDIKEFRLRLVSPPQIEFRPGQYVQVRVPTREGPIFRAYSISSPVSKRDSIALVVRKIPGGVASTWLHALDPGDEVVFTGPYGDFRLSDDPATEVVCVVGGCGLAPAKSIIESILYAAPHRPCALFFGARTVRDLFYREHFAALARAHPSFRFHCALSEPGDDEWTGETGFIHLVVDTHLEPGARRQAFLCGPPPMIEAVIRVLETKGVAAGNIYFDKYW